MAPQVSWIDAGAGVSLPCVVTRDDDSDRWIATLANWRVASAGETPCDALQALTREVHRRMHRALAKVRAEEVGCA